MVRSTDRPAMTIAVDLGRKATKQTKTIGVSGNYLKKKLYCFVRRFFLPYSEDPDEMTHYAICKNTYLGVSTIQRVNTSHFQVFICQKILS